MTGIPFAVVDELSCYFDSAAEPNNVHLEAWLPGHLDPGRLRAAVATVLSSQPRARVRQAPRRWWHRGYAWETPAETARPSDIVSVTCWRSDADLDSARARFLATAPPLDRSPPFRLLLATGPDRDSVILNAHHAAFDGQSCLRLLRLIADQYSDAAARSEDGARGARRIPAEPGKRTAKNAASRRAARISPRHGDSRRQRHALGYGFHLLAWPDVPPTPRPETGPRATVNDVLVAALIETIRQWNSNASPRHPIRISVPADARPPGLADELGNLSRLCTVTVSAGAAPSTGAPLLSTVAEQTRDAKRQPGPQVGDALAAVAKAPLPAAAKRPLLRLAVRCLGRLVSDTSLLSNLGNVIAPPRFGQLTPSRMWFSTSAHMPRGLSVGAITVEGRLHLCFRYRRALFDDTAAARFAAGYATALTVLARGGDPPEPPATGGNRPSRPLGQAR